MCLDLAQEMRGVALPAPPSCPARLVASLLLAAASVWFSMECDFQTLRHFPRAFPVPLRVTASMGPEHTVQFCLQLPPEQLSLTGNTGPCSIPGFPYLALGDGWVCQQLTHWSSVPKPGFEDGSRGLCSRSLKPVSSLERCHRGERWR